MQLETMSLLFLGSTLHVSGAVCIHHQECLKSVHTVTGTIMYQYGVRSGLLKGVYSTVPRHSAVHSRSLNPFQQTGSYTILIHDCTSNFMYSFKTLLMMGANSTRDM